MKFSIKGLLLLITLVSLCVALAVSQLRLAEAKLELETQREKFHFLNVTDPEKIAAVRMPRFVSEKMWQWRGKVEGKRKVLVASQSETELPSQNSRFVDCETRPLSRMASRCRGVIVWIEELPQD